MKAIVESDADKVDSTNNHGNAVRCRRCDSIRKPLSVGYRILVSKLDSWFDTWRCFLWLIGLYLYFSYVVQLPIVFLGVANPLYALGWATLWITVASLLAYRELIRRGKTMTMPKWVHNPKAVDEYLELIRET